MNTIPTPTIETKIIDAQEFTRTAWTVGDHVLVRTQREDAPHANWITNRLNNDAPRVSDDFDWFDDTAPVTYSVNWSAMGDQSPEVAIEYANRLMAAANAARVFTAIRAENK